MLESRTSDENNIRRRRECEICHKRFTTFERVESLSILVVKASGEREPYDRRKLQQGIATSCAKLSVSAADIDDLLDGLELELLGLGRREIPSKQLGEMVLSRLRCLNQVAYVRFASVYRQFQSIDDFIAELSELGAPSVK